MSQQTARPRSVIRTAHAIQAQLEQEGYRRGFPPQLGRLARHADLACFRKAKCPACKSRMAAVPFHRPGVEGGYKLLLACHVCPAAEIA